MFNRLAQRYVVTFHNIQDKMSKSEDEHPSAAGYVASRKNEVKKYATANSVAENINLLLSAITTNSHLPLLKLWVHGI